MHSNNNRFQNIQLLTVHAIADICCQVSVMLIILFNVVLYSCFDKGCPKKAEKRSVGNTQ